MQRVLICGDRNWRNFDVIIKALSEVQQSEGVEVVIEGGATGAGTLGKQAAFQLGIPVETYEANWRAHGYSTGPIRNRRMLTEGRPTLVLAFHPFIDNGKGTKNMVEISMKAGVPVKIITGREDGKES